MDLLLEKLESTICPHCEGLGMRVVDDGKGRKHAEPCSCRKQKRLQRVIEQARIPKRFEHCTFESYHYDFGGADRSLSFAYRAAQKFVDGYPLLTDGTGLMLSGSVGVGKTHLVISMLHALIAERGATGLFVDYRELLKQVQNSYNARVAATELEVLAPVFNAEILVLDEIGASKPTDWVWDTVAHILNSRYNDRRTTILTSNYANLPPLGALTDSQKKGLSQAQQDAMLANRDETLGDRIGERMRSRIQEMCAVVEMQGEDFRQNTKRARFI